MDKFADAYEHSFKAEEIDDYFKNTSKTINAGSFGMVEIGM